MSIKNKRGYTSFAEALYQNRLIDIAKLYVLNGYIPTETDFKDYEEDDYKEGAFEAIFTDVEDTCQLPTNGSPCGCTNEKTQVIAQFMELARTVKINAVRKEAESKVCCDECFDF